MWESHPKAGAMQSMPEAQACKHAMQIFTKFIKVHLGPSSRHRHFSSYASKDVHTYMYVCMHVCICVHIIYICYAKHFKVPVKVHSKKKSAGSAIHNCFSFVLFWALWAKRAKGNEYLENLTRLCFDNCKSQLGWLPTICFVSRKCMYVVVNY